MKSRDSRVQSTENREQKKTVKESLYSVLCSLLSRHSGFSRLKGGVLGFTLFEVMIATLMIGVLASGIFAAISFSKRMATRAQEKAIAVSFVEKKLNELKRMPAANRLTVNESKTKATDGLSGTLATEVTQSAEGDPKLQEVRVAFVWNDPLGAGQKELAVTVFYKETP